jgi:hypothetical protein
MKILIILFLSSLFSIFAQQIAVQGRVVDSETNSPLSNANVFLLTDFRTGTSTNKSGEFRLFSSVERNDTLTISFVGYETKNIAVKDLTNIPSIPTSDGNIFYTFSLRQALVKKE